MRRITISLDESVTDFEAMDAITKVVAGGYVSKGANGQDHYCWHAQFRMTYGWLHVSVRPKYGTKSDRFVVYRTDENNQQM